MQNQLSIEAVERLQKAFGARFGLTHRPGAVFKLEPLLSYVLAGKSLLCICEKTSGNYCWMTYLSRTEAEIKSMAVKL